MLKSSLDLPTKEEISAHSKNNQNNNIEEKNSNEIRKINNDDSKINIINKKTSLLPSISNKPPAPPLNKNEEQFIPPLNQNGNHNINYNQNNHFNINYIPKNDLDVNNYQSNINNNNIYPQIMPNYNTNAKYINVVQPVIIDSSYNHPNVMRERQEREERRTFCAIFLSWCFNYCLFFFCCLIIRQFRGNNNN